MGVRPLSSKRREGLFTAGNGISQTTFAAAFGLPWSQLCGSILWPFTFQSWLRSWLLFFIVSSLSLLSFLARLCYTADIKVTLGTAGLAKSLRFVLLLLLVPCFLPIPAYKLYHFCRSMFFGSALISTLWLSCAPSPTFRCRFWVPALLGQSGLRSGS